MKGFTLLYFRLYINGILLTAKWYLQEYKTVDNTIFNLLLAMNYFFRIDIFHVTG